MSKGWKGCPGEGGEGGVHGNGVGAASRESGGIVGGGGGGGGNEWRKDLERKRWRNGVAIHWGTEGGGRGEEEQWRGVRREGGWEM